MQHCKGVPILQVTVINRQLSAPDGQTGLKLLSCWRTGSGAFLPKKSRILLSTVGGWRSLPMVFCITKGGRQACFTSLCFGGWGCQREGERCSPHFLPPHFPSYFCIIALLPHFLFACILLQKFSTFLQFQPLSFVCSKNSAVRISSLILWKHVKSANTYFPGKWHISP